jgi:predicted acyltransferase
VLSVGASVSFPSAGLLPQAVSETRWTISRRIAIHLMVLFLVFLMVFPPDS